MRQQLAIGDVGDLVTALGLVHVVGRDQHGQPIGRERVDLAPELAPRLRIDAGGRLVEQQQLRVRQGAGAEREPLLPAARERAGKLLLATVKAEPLHHRLRGALRIGEAVDARDELQVLAHREVLIEAEALRHVADMHADLVRLGADVVAETRAAPAVGREQPAQHADGRGLARAVRPEEAVDRAALHPHREIAHHDAVAERFGEAFDLDGDVGRGHFFASPLSATCTGCPTRRPSGFSGRASIMNTSLLRSSRL